MATGIDRRGAASLESVVEALVSLDPDPGALIALCRQRNFASVIALHDACRSASIDCDRYATAALERLGSAPSNLVGLEASGPTVSWLLRRSEPQFVDAACALCEASAAFESGDAVGSEALASLRRLFEGELQLVSCAAWLDLESGRMRKVESHERVELTTGSVLLAGDDAVLGASVIDPFDKITRRRNLREVQERLQRAAKWLARACPGFEGAICRYLRSIVPMQRVERGVPSASTNAVVGAICVTDHDDPVVLAEQIVHESAHGLLFLLQEHDPLLDPAIHGDGWSGRGLYSPWRDDPRPIAGLLHGALVFSRVAWMHAALMHESATSRARLVALVPQLEIGMELLSMHGHWTPLGLQMKIGLEDLLAKLRPISASIESSTAPVYLEASSVLSATGGAVERQRWHRARFAESFD